MGRERSVLILVALLFIRSDAATSISSSKSRKERKSLVGRCSVIGSSSTMMTTPDILTER